MGCCLAQYLHVGSTLYLVINWHNSIMTVSTLLQLCYDVICPPLQYEPSKDVFNAAQSGAMVPNLVSHEFKYLLEQLKSVIVYEGVFNGAILVL